MASSSVHDKLERVRKPRVHISYQVETEGAVVEKELPFVVGVLGDFSGQPTQPLKPLKDRKFIQIDRDNFNDVMGRMTPGVQMRVENTLANDGSEMAVNLRFQLDGRLRAGPHRAAGRAAEQAAGDARQAPRPAHQDRPLRGPGKSPGPRAAEHGRSEEALRPTWASRRPRARKGVRHERDATDSTRGGARRRRPRPRARACWNRPSSPPARPSARARRTSSAR